MGGPWRIYGDLAGWWPLLSAPEDYAEEAATFFDVLSDARGTPPRTLLEMGCGGGNTAGHLSGRAALTLTDLSPAMLEVCRRHVPGAEHLPGDMRTLRLGRTFDAVLVHDAASYLTTEDDLRAAAATAAVHLAPEGAALFVPDATRESLRPGASLGGHDGPDGRSLRYLMWTYDPDPGDSLYSAAFAIVLREKDGPPRGVFETHTLGALPRSSWLRALKDAGLRARAIPFRHSTFAPGDEREMFEGVLPR